MFYYILLRPDLTFTVDWALRANYLSICLLHTTKGAEREEKKKKKKKKKS